MNNWRHTFDVTTLWGQLTKLTEGSDEIPLTDHYGTYSKQIAEKIKASSFWNKYQDQIILERICNKFESFDENTDVAEFDYVWSLFYNWCDYERRVWVKTW